jgi:Pyruvate/2-oxoacid:ferredoxin oxidoreductase delta subunit/coenzyme F420-reducing hydrogenase delta subunit
MVSGISLFEKILSQAHLVVKPGLCLRLRHKKSSCRLCLEYCPRGAINIDEALHVESSLCSGCGVCVNLCPTDVFHLRDLSYESLLAQVKKGDVAEFACSLSASDESSLKVPCLGFLNEAVFVGAIGCGAQGIRLNVAHCKGCKYALGLRAAGESMKRANRILALFGLSRRVMASAEDSDGSHNQADRQLYSRREFFAYLQGETGKQVAAAIEGMDSDGDMGGATRAILEPKLPVKRGLLLEHIKKLGKPVADQARSDGLPFARVEIGDSCDGCGMCVAFCPTGALRSYEEGDRQVIDFSSRYCLACGLCAEICPQATIAYSASVNPGALATDARMILMEHRKSVCAQCGQTYIAVLESKLCLNCRKKKEMEEWLARMWQQS